MNWYKRIKLAQITKRELTYLDIGHNEDWEKPNYIWVFDKGKLKIKKVDADIPGHLEAFPDISYNIYSGRYEGDTGILSFMKPLYGVNAQRDIPSFLINRLYEAFPNITEIKIF